MKPSLIAIIAPNLKGKPASQPKTPMVGAGSIVAIRNGELREVITVRTYYNERGNGMQPVRASIWVKPAKPGTEWSTGSGSAGGCGYHKESQAIADAVSNAGIEMYGTDYMRHDKPVDLTARFEFGGRGSSGYETIFRAIARAAGYRGRMAWVTHGL